MRIDIQEMENAKKQKGQTEEEKEKKSGQNAKSHKVHISFFCVAAKLTNFLIYFSEFASCVGKWQTKNDNKNKTNR